MLGLRFCARAFSSCGERGPLFIAMRGPLTIAATLVAEHRLQTRRLSSCGSRAQLLHGIWDLPRPGLKPVSSALAGRFSTTAPPGKPNCVFFIVSSYLLKWSMLSSILFLNSVIIFITNFLNSLLGRLIISVSLFFSRVFSCSFNWEYFLYLFILSNFLFLYEFRWNSYLL